MYHTLGTIEPDGTPVRNTLGCKRDIEYCWNTILSRHNGAVREIATGLHHEPRSEEKQRGPARVSRGATKISPGWRRVPSWGEYSTRAIPSRDQDWTAGR